MSLDTSSMQPAFALFVHSFDEFIKVLCMHFVELMLPIVIIINSEIMYNTYVISSKMYEQAMITLKL